MHTTRIDGGTKMYAKDIFISSSFEIWLLTDKDTRLNKNDWWKEAHLQDWLWNNATFEG
jgi:hypothetical protein